MTRYEELISEYDGRICVQERAMMQCEGLYCDGYIWIKKDLSEARKCAILAEEIGHMETSSGNILDQKSINNQKQEMRARKWAYKKIVPLQDILRSVIDGYTETYEIAEYLDVDEQFLIECLRTYGFLSDM